MSTLTLIEVTAAPGSEARSTRRSEFLGAATFSGSTTNTAIIFATNFWLYLVFQLIIYL